MKTRFMDINLLDILARPSMAGLRREFNLRSFPAGSRPFAPPQAENVVFVVASGRVRIYLSFEEREFTLSHLEPGDIYSTHTRAEIEVLEDIRLLVLSTERFRELIVAHPDLTRTMVRVLGDILQNSFDIINSLVFKDIPRRVVEFLHFEAVAHGEERPEGRLVRLSVNTEQLAQIVGSTRQTVSETLSRLYRQNLVRRLRRGVYLIPDLPALKDFAAER
ncbi:MAG: Crp/Fnr family transcriptional regulator [Thermodesulfobacteriota bacterium]